MKINWTGVYYILLLIATFIMFGVGAWGMWQSNKRSKASDEKWDRERAEMTRRSNEVHQKTLEYLAAQRREEHERHEAYMKRIVDRKQPWEEGEE